MNEQRKLTPEERKANRKNMTDQEKKEEYDKNRGPRKSKGRKRRENRKVSNHITAYIGVKRDLILEVLDEYNIEKITLEEVKDWENIPEIMPEYAQKIMALSSNEVSRSNLRKKEALNTATDEEVFDSLKNKLVSAKSPKLIRLHEREEQRLEADLLYFFRGIDGWDPVNVAESYKDDEYVQLIAKFFKIRLDDHSTYPIHSSGCDGNGKNDNCDVRIARQKSHYQKEAEEQRKLESGMKEISIMTNDVQKGDYVKFYYDSKIGIVKKVNKVSYTVEGIGSSKDLGLLKNYRTNPEWLKKIDLSTYPSYEIDDEVMVHCLDGHKRFSKIVEKRNDCFYLIEYFVKSKNTNMHCWVDCSRFVE